MGATLVDDTMVPVWRCLTRFPAQIKESDPLPTPAECEGRPAEDVIKLVASKLLGDTYKLEDKPLENGGSGFEVFDILTSVCAVLLVPISHC